MFGVDLKVCGIFVQFYNYNIYLTLKRAVLQKVFLSLDLILIFIILFLVIRFFVSSGVIYPLLLCRDFFVLIFGFSKSQDSENSV